MVVPQTRGKKKEFVVDEGLSVAKFVTYAPVTLNSPDGMLDYHPEGRDDAVHLLFTCGQFPAPRFLLGNVSFGVNPLLTGESRIGKDFNVLRQIFIHRLFISQPFVVSSA